jgi:hypothetical protein
VPAQLVILLLFVLPGSVYQTCRTFFAGPSPEERDMGSKLLRALAFSTVLNGIYIATLGPWLAKRIAAEPDSVPGVVLDQPRAVGVLGLLFLVCTRAHREPARAHASAGLSRDVARAG